ncbi:DUF3131 domain-containing protein [Nodularia sp. NIES-3585]|uniref:DUF3131 domain-containing protein n=1 Tax=Nodularia sp. NIES-3585 TaxID=1973477 RepID=UPI0011318588
MTSQQPLVCSPQARPCHPYLAGTNKGYFSGRYENRQLRINTSLNVNTNAVILESLQTAISNYIRYIVAPSSHPPQSPRNGGKKRINL